MLVVELNPKQGFLELCRVLLSAELSIHYTYPVLNEIRARPAVVLSTDDQVFAGQILHRKRFMLLGENDLGDNATPGAESSGFA